MNIIIATGAKSPYIAGIFERWEEATDYMLIKPNDIDGSKHVNSNEAYPFYIVEKNGEFFSFQIIADALSFCSPGSDEYTLYIITRDYIPSVAWNDEMGTLTHVHANADDG